ncbi:type II secretion system protein [Methylotenera sp. 73s]|nr:type II secretion system protein [Methylotenera sp. 73s]
MAANMPIGNWPMNKQAGFTYMGLLMIVAIAGIAMAGVGVVWHQESQREREKELLFIGAEYRKAIGSYFESSPGGIKQYPQTLQELVLDKRFPNIKRHIRQLYADPFAKDNQSWNLVLEQGQIRGVYSTAEAKPIKKFGFASTEESFSEAESYSDWRFIYAPGSLASSAPIQNANQPDNLPDSQSNSNEPSNNEFNSLPPSINAPNTSEPEIPPSNSMPFETLPPSINAIDNSAAQPAN